MVPRGGIEPPTLRFSVERSTGRASARGSVGPDCGAICAGRRAPHFDAASAQRGALAQLGKALRGAPSGSPTHAAETPVALPLQMASEICLRATAAGVAANAVGNGWPRLGHGAGIGSGGEVNRLVGRRLTE